MAIDLNQLSEQELIKLTKIMTPKMTKYSPHVPTNKQAAFLLLDNREAFYGGAAGGGKGTSLDTKILTATRGWQTMGSILVGDVVFTESGEQTEVIWKSEVYTEPCYEFTFNKGAQKIVTGVNHSWVVNRRRSDNRRVIEKQNTGQLFKRFSNNTNKNRCSLLNIPAIPLGLQYEEKSLIVDPYVFGVWLGDGNRQNGAISSVDVGIMEQFEERGYDIYMTDSSVQHDRDDIHPDGRLHHWNSKSLRDELRLLGFLSGKSKIIPEEYMTGSIEQRMNLLWGIMDTDGCAVNRSTGDCELTLADEGLAFQCQELIRSFGIKINAKYSLDERDDPRYPKGVYHRWRLNWTTSRPMFTLERKLCRQPKEDKEVFKRHFITDIQEVLQVELQCIQVASPTHMYLVTESLIPTHNSDALLMAALQYVDRPKYAAIIFRRTYSDLALPGALIERAKQWLSPYEHEGVRWVEKEKTWHFPSGATLSFGYLENDGDKYRYQSSEFQFIGYDELTQLLMSVYTYMFSRLRRLKDSDIPLRVRSASNPGNDGHEWVKQRFITEGPDKGRVYIPASLSDNPFLDAETYAEGLDELDIVTRAQLKEGNWDVKRVGAMFDRDWCEIVPFAPAGIRNVRFWDMAATELKKGKDPDWTAGCRLGEKDGIYYVMHMRRMRKTPADNEKEIQGAAMSDGKSTTVFMEQEPGSSGLMVTDHYSRNVLKGFAFFGKTSTGSKVTRANPVSSAMQQGRVKVVYGPWNGDFFDELEMFPGGRHNDQVDALSGAFDELHKIDFALPMSVGERDSYWDEESYSGEGDLEYG